jgi:hypothetical protein
MVIWKFGVAAGEFTHEMPEGAAILTVQTQADEPQMWALVDPDQPRRPRRFATLATGQPIPEELTGAMRYIGTFQLAEGGLVFHVFEVEVRAQ